MISMTAEQKSYLCPEGSEISAADNYITLQGYITFHPEGEKMSLCLCGCGEETTVYRGESRLYIEGHNWRGKHHSEKTKEKLRTYRAEKSPWWGKHHSNEAKEKNRLAHLGKPPWNKGKTGIYSEEAKRRMRLNHAGVSGEKHPMWGKHHSNEAKEKNRLAHLGKPSGRKGKACSEEHKEKIRLAKLGKPSMMKGKHLSEEAREKMRRNHADVSGENNPMWGKHLLGLQGENHPNWKGGISFLPYCSKFNEKLKERVRERDGRICQLCGRTELENGRKLTVHHVHYDKENCYPDLLSICLKRNSVVNFDRDYWEQRCMEILQRRGILNWKPVNVTLLENIERQGG